MLWCAKTFYMKIIFFTLLIIHQNLSLATKLTTDEQKALEKASFITQTQEIEDESWPRVIIKAKIKTNPLSAVSIFAAYTHQKNYIPNLKKSVIEKIVSPKVVQVNYTLDLPWPLSDSRYINEHTLESGHHHHYKVSWTSLQNSSAKSVIGSATFLPFPGNKSHTLMVYKNHVVPKSIFAGLLQGPMISDTESSIKATINEIDKLTVQKSTKLLRFEANILDAMNNKTPQF